MDDRTRIANRTAQTALTRRAFARRSAWAALGLAGLFSLDADELHAEANKAGSGGAPIRILERSPFVYISPLKTNGRESQCHAELWYAWLDGSVIVTVATDRWKAQSVAQGLNQARIWVGDYGRWRNWYGGTNDAFKNAPSFVAKGEIVKDDALFERMLATYEKKYPEEVADWRDKMRRGNVDGSRTLLRYTPPTV